MKCYECGNSFIKQDGDLKLPSKVLGSFFINNVQYYKCQQCGEVLLPDETWRAADEKEDKLIKKILNNLPIKDFIGASKAASIIGMSRQGLHKNRRISRGFIYSLLHEGKILYHIKSVELFKKTGDGRFPLQEQSLKDKRYDIAPRKTLRRSPFTDLYDPNSIVTKISQYR